MADFTARNVGVNALSADLYYDKTRVFTLGTAYDFVDSTAAINRMEVNIGKGIGYGTSGDRPAPFAGERRQ